jgi:hypothetical protein
VAGCSNQPVAASSSSMKARISDRIELYAVIGPSPSPLLSSDRASLTPRMHASSDSRYFADRDPLTRAVMDRMLAGVSTRRFADVGEPVGSEVEQASSSTAKTAVSDMFIERTRTALGE